MKYVEIEIPEEQKEKYLNEFSPICLGMDAVRRCIHCEKKIKVKDYKLAICKPNNFKRNLIKFKEVGVRQHREEVLIFCPNFPECDGTVIDWQ